MSRAIDHIGGKPIDATWICERYDQVRNWLPPASFPEYTTKAGSLIDLIDEFDVFVLDAYGVLNVGAAPVPTAPDAVRELRSHGKTVLVLTNGATATSAQAWHRYLSYGLELDLEHVISSRDVMVAHMHELNLRFGVAAPAHVDLANLPGPTVLLTDASAYADVEAFLLLSSGAWSNAQQDQLCDALTLKPRPIWVANPDMAAPCDGGFTLEPGHFALGASKASGIKPEYFCKPFSNTYAAVTARLQRLGKFPDDLRRVAMVGDSLHTDIWGGAAAGWRTVLVRNHGLLRGEDADLFCDRFAIRPDFSVATT